MSLPEALERAATALSQDADSIRPANGDPSQLLSTLNTAAAARVLTWLLVNEPNPGEELLAEWCEDERGVDPLQAIDEKALPKAGRKVLRRAIHRLRTSGVEVTAPRLAGPVVSRLGAVHDEIAGAYMTAVDPRGSYLIFLVEAHPSGGARLFQVLLDEIRGVVEFDVYATGRSKLRSFLRKLTEGGSTGAVEVDSDIVRGLLQRIVSIHPSDRPFPRGFSEWRRKLEEGATTVTPGARLFEVAGPQLDPARISAEQKSAACERTADRVRSRTLGPWLSDSPLLSTTTAKLEQAIDALLELEGEARAAALETALESATEVLFDLDHRVQTISRLEVSGYVAWCGGRKEQARDLLAAAAAFRDTQWKQNPVARAMLEGGMASVLKRVEEDSQKSGGHSISDSRS